MASARTAGRRFSPLDEELALLPGELTPHLQEQLAHLGAWMPFAPAAAMLQRFTQVTVSEATAQRLTEVVGRAYVAVQQAAVERIEQELPPVPTGPERALLSVDGAMVPLCGGEWAEVKTLVVGEVGAVGVAELPAPDRGGTPREGHATALSYCSRLADVETFNHAVLGELHRRGVETAGQVAAVSDGADWIQGFIDLHCPQALRILDFPHAAERLARLGQAVAPGDATWLPTQLHRLKHEGPDGVLADLRPLVAAHLSAHPDTLMPTEDLAYLDKRVAQMQYPAYQAQGWPIGSGCVESANKLVVEARLKGAGMHWARVNVNPLLALRNAVCTDRWEEAWTLSSAYLRHQALPRCPPPPLPFPPAPAALLPPPPAPRPTIPPGPHRPAPTHPWKRPLIPSKPSSLSSAASSAKL